MAETVDRANWNYVYEKGFLEILTELKLQDRCTTPNGWTTEGWNIILRKFNEKFPLACFSKHHLQEKNKELKATYKAIRDARKESGAGLDPTTGMVTGGPNVWDKIEKGSIATGDLSFTSIDPVNPPHSIGATSTSQVEARVDQEASEARVDQEASEAQSASMGPVPSAVHPEGSEAQSAPAAVGTSTQDHSGKKRKQSQVAAALDDYLDHKKLQSEKAVEAILEKKRREEEYSIENCLDTTNAMEELTDEDKAIASEVFENEVNSEVFMKQKDLKVRLIWLRRKIRKLAAT